MFKFKFILTFENLANDKLERRHSRSHRSLQHNTYFILRP